jgi:hypothetical protein
VAAEALLAKIIRNTLLPDHLHTFFDCVGMFVQTVAAQDEMEAVRLVGAPAQLSIVSLHVEYVDALDLERIPIRCIPARHAEPLPRYRVAILEACIADVPGRYIGKARQLPRHPLRVGPDFLNPEIVVFAVAGEFETEFLDDLEVLRRGAHGGREQRGAERAGPVRK